MSACLNRFKRFNSRFARRILRNDENDHAHVLVNAFDLERCRQWIKVTKFARALDVQRVGIAIATQTRTPAAPADIRSFGVRCALRVPRTSDTGSSFLCSNGPVSLGLPILPAQTVSSVGLQPPRAFLARTYCHPPAARSGSCMPGPFGELAPEPFLRATEIAGPCQFKLSPDRSWSWCFSTDADRDRNLQAGNHEAGMSEGIIGNLLSDQIEVFAVCLADAGRF